jgi:hypothetical protein
MLRNLFLCLIGLASVTATAQAGDHYYFPGYAFAPSPVLYAAPVVSYQPAYVVPTPFVTVQSYPVTTVAYSTQYYAPMVPSVPVVPVTYSSYYAPRAVVAPAVYAVPGYYGRGHHRRFRGVEIEIERDGDIEIDYR